jgi:hypothetical protein
MTQQDYTPREHVKIWYDNHILDRLIAVEKAVGLFPPKPPSLKEQALDDLHIAFDRGCLSEGQADTIRRALEALDD